MAFDHEGNQTGYTESPYATLLTMYYEINHLKVGQSIYLLSTSSAIESSTRKWALFQTV